MNILFRYSLMMCLCFVASARAETCLPEFTTDKQNLTTLIAGLRDRGLTELTNSFDADRIEVVQLPENITTSPLARAKLPGLRRRKAVLEIARLGFRGDHQRQRSELEVVKALFKIELNARFRDRPPRAGGRGFLARPREVGQYQTGRVTALLANFYAELESLTLLNPAMLLPPEDPGRPWMPSAAILTGPPRQLKPNRHDLENYYQTGGEPVLKSAIEERYERALMFAYWRIYAMRFAGTATATGLLAATVAVTLPAANQGVPAPELSASQFGTGEAIRDSELTDAQRDQARTQLRRLHEQLERVRHQSMSEPPTAQIESIKQQILNLQNKYPFLLLPGESSH